MAAKSYAEAKQLLLSEIEKMWLKKPRDVENLSNVLGAFKQSGIREDLRPRDDQRAE